MIDYSQLNRPMKLTAPLGLDVLLVTGFRGTEGISRLYRYELDLLGVRPFDPEFEKVLGQPIKVELELPNGLTRTFGGICSRFAQGRQDDTFNHYRATMVPRFWLWTQRKQSRIFQQKTVPEILHEVLDGLDVSWSLTGQYEPRDYCVQYRETDFAFASRLMEEEGIYYCFVHTDDGQQMLVADANVSLPDVPDPASIVYEEVEDGVRDEVRVSSWEKTQSVGPTQVTLWDHHFELPGQHLDATQEMQKSVKAGTVEHQLEASDHPLEQYDYPGGYAGRRDGVDPGGGDRTADLNKVFADAKRTTRLRMERHAAERLRIAGAGNCLHFAAGHKFALARHFNGDGKYLLIGLEHEARLSAPFRSEENVADDSLQYTNRFTCLPDGLPYRPPRRTPRPKIVGVQTATVVGPEGEELFVDKYGRVKVQFHWDRQGKHNADSSCWLRVGQVWAGPTWGGFFWPRIGHEVIVVFAEGDPDQPVIIGSVYNAKNMPPIDLPKEKMVGGIKSCSFGGDPAVKANALIFHDTPGKEYVQVHSETNEMQNCETNKFHYVSHGHYQLIGSLFP
jgi:type VI secretion system secreted protein VgrG